MCIAMREQAQYRYPGCHMVDADRKLPGWSVDRAVTRDASSF